jgi:hypothetical protein
MAKTSDKIVDALPVSAPPTPAGRQAPTQAKATVPPSLRPLATTDDPDDLPEVVSMGLAKAKGGWCVLLIRSQGYNILDTEVLSGPEPRGIAIERYKIESVRQLFPHLDLAKK